MCTACIRTRAHVALWLLLVGFAAQCHTAWDKQHVPRQPSLATWTEASVRCAAVGRRLAPHELAAEAAADGLFGPLNMAEPRCTPEQSDATIVWVGNRGSRLAPLDLGGPWRPGADLCQGLVFNHTSRQAHLTGERCDQLHCFLCSAPQDVDSSACNMTGQHCRRCAATSCRSRPLSVCLSPTSTESFSVPLQSGSSS
jgi:hypothetical protein